MLIPKIVILSEKWVIRCKNNVNLQTTTIS